MEICCVVYLKYENGDFLKGNFRNIALYVQYLGIMERDNLLYAFLMTNEFTHWILANFVQVFF
jgi:hypothetical protein